MVSITKLLGGVAWCSWKGLKLLLHLDKDDRTKNLYGFKDPKLDTAWERVYNDEPRSHTLTNLIVEWNRLDAQRGAKLFCMVIGVTNVLWLIVTLIK